MNLRVDKNTIMFIIVVNCEQFAHSHHYILPMLLILIHKTLLYLAIEGYFRHLTKCGHSKDDLWISINNDETFLILLRLLSYNVIYKIIPTYVLLISFLGKIFLIRL